MAKPVSIQPGRERNVTMFYEDVAVKSKLNKRLFLIISLGLTLWIVGIVVTPLFQCVIQSWVIITSRQVVLGTQKQYPYNDYLNSYFILTDSTYRLYLFSLKQTSVICNFCPRYCPIFEAFTLFYVSLVCILTYMLSVPCL